MIVRLLTLAALSALCAAWVPAHPDALADLESVEAGPAIGEAQLAPYFTTPALKSALSELQAGRAANALRYLPSRPADLPPKGPGALGLKAAHPPGAPRG